MDKKECVEGLKIIGWDLHHILDCNCANCKALQFAIDNLQEQPREEYVENSLKEQVKKNIKEMSKQCFGYEPSDDVIERTTMEVFFSLSPLLGNKNKGLSCPQEQPKERKEE